MGVGLSFCVRRLGPFSKCVLRPEVIIFGVLRPATFWRLRPRPNFYGVLRLTVFLRLASGVLDSRKKRILKLVTLSEILFLQIPIFAPPDTFR